MIINYTTDIYRAVSGLFTAYKAKKARITMGNTKKILTTAIMVAVFVLGAVTEPALAQTASTASSVTCNSVVLQGDVTVNPAGTPTTIWFEWGTSYSFGNTTSQQTVTSSANFSQSLTGLSENTTYYYRARANNSSTGDMYGATFLFTTPSCGTTQVNNPPAGTSYWPYYQGYVGYFGTGSSGGSGWGGSGWGGAQSPTVNTYAAGLNDSFATLNGYLSTNGSTDSVRWFEWGDSQYNLNRYTRRVPQSGEGSFSDTITNLSRSVPYYYRAVAQNSYGTSYGQIMTFTLGYGNSQTSQGYSYGAVSATAQTSVTTNFATSIGETNAQLNGLVTISNGNVYTNGYFEWGTTSSLGNTTASKGVGNSSAMSFNESLNGLSPGTTYYYRAVATNQYGAFMGEIRNFKTTGGYQPVAVVKQTSSFVAGNGGVSSSKPSLIYLVITTDNERINKGDYITFTTTYKNISSVNLRNVVLRIELPKELTYQDSSRGIFSSKDNTVTVEIGDLYKGESGTVVVKANVEQSLTPDKAIIVLARMVYTIPAGSQEEVVAYVIEKPEYISGNAALSLFSGGFFPGNLIEWLALVVFIFILILLSRSLYGSYAEKKKEQDATKKQ